MERIKMIFADALPVSGEDGMNLQMWRVGPEKVEDPHIVLERCGEDLKQSRLEHWESPYPIEALRKDAEERRVYRLRLDRELAGPSQ